ncbi:MAG: hypothetical protein MUD01_18575 [Chloroflexaceae bacterium]|jgi:hypothetical protein|nr:hypothetical protein [Chloroflexaceae bacterium]
MTTQESTLDATITAFRNGITSMGIQRATAVIDDWLTTLQASGRTEFMQISDDLTDLRDMLVNGELDGERIGPLLSSLGSSTGQAAGQAPADVKPKLEQLGQMLTRAASQLGGH